MKHMLFATVLLAGIAPMLSGCSSPDAQAADEALAILAGVPATEISIYKIESRHEMGRHDDEYFRGHPILARVEASAEQREQVLHVLKNAGLYRHQGMKCFAPGMAISLHDGEQELDLVICLKCGWIYFYRGAELETFGMSGAGKDNLREIYDATFADAAE